MPGATPDDAPDIHAHMILGEIVKYTCTSIINMALLQTRKSIGPSKPIMRRKGKAKIKEDIQISTHNETDDVKLAHVMQKTTKMSNKLDKEYIKFDSRPDSIPKKCYGILFKTTITNIMVYTPVYCSQV